MAKKDKNSLLNIHYSRTMTSDNLSKAANYVGKYVLKGLGAFGKIMTAPFVQQGPTSATIYKSKELLAKERTIENKSEELLGKAMTWVSPLNYGAAVWNGHGLNARKGEEEVASWSPAWQAVGRLGELYVGPKAVKGVKAAPRVVVNTAAKAGVKPAKAAVVAREINNAAKKGVLTLEQLQPKVRTRYGDVEIDNPLLAYRLGTGIVKDFLKTGKVRAPELEGYGDEIVSTKFGSMNFGKDFKNPMFAQGKLFFGLPRKADRDLLVTSEPLALAVKSSSKVPSSVNGTIDVRYAGFNNGKIRSRRVLDYEGQLNSENTSAYTWDPNYGYKKVTAEPPTSLKFFERKPSKISEAERTGVPKGERNIKLHGEFQAPYYDYSLINKHYEPWTVNEKGLFVFASPEKNKKLGTIHFSMNEPVMDHFMGSWGDAPTVTVIPYRNMRSQTPPVDIAIMDTFFPNYKGLKVSSRGSKTLTGDKVTYDYYKSKGIDVEFSSEMESLLNEMKDVRSKLDSFTEQEKYGFPPNKDAKALLDRKYQLKEQIDEASRKWARNNVKIIPNFEKLNEFGRVEGLDMDSYPYQLGSKGSMTTRASRELGLDYTWQSDPSNHSVFLQNPEYLLKQIEEGEYGKVRPEYKRYLEWLLNHKADYRKQGGKMNILEFLKNGSKIHIKEENKGKFTSYCGGKVTDECILKGKNSSNPAIRKRATFAANARKWNHEKDGKIKKAQYGIPLNLSSEDVLGGLRYIAQGLGKVWDIMNAPVVNTQSTTAYLPNGSLIEIPGILGGAPEYLPGRFGRLASLKNRAWLEKSNPIVDEGSLLAAKDWVKMLKELRGRIGGRPAGSKNVPKKAPVVEQPPVQKVETSYAQSGTSRERFLENRKMRISKRGRVSSNDKNARAMEASDARITNAGNSNLKRSQLQQVERNLHKYPKHEVERFQNKTLLNMYRKGRSEKDIQKATREFYKYLADNYGYFKDGGILKAQLGLGLTLFNNPENPNAVGGDIVNSYIRNQLMVPYLLALKEEYEKWKLKMKLQSNTLKSSLFDNLLNTGLSIGTDYLKSKLGIGTEKADS